MIDIEFTYDLTDEDVAAIVVLLNQIVVDEGGVIASPISNWVIAARSEAKDRWPQSYRSSMLRLNDEAS